MTIATELQADQRAEAWDVHVSLYEEVFEPLSLDFALQAVARLGPLRGRDILEVAAGPGGAALAMARRGATVTAIDTSPAMVARIERRAATENLDLKAAVMDGTNLAFADESFDGALSVFGVILFPDAVRGLTEMRRVVRPGGQISVVTWTQSHRYELAAHLAEAIASLGPIAAAPAETPAQLRFVEPDAFRQFFAEAGLQDIELETVETFMSIPTARWLCERIRFAPGMTAWLASLGERGEDALAALVARLEKDHGTGPLSLGAVAMIGSAQA